MSGHSCLPLIGLIVAMSLAGCAGSRAAAPATAGAEQAPLPHTPDQARAELHRLERQIQHSRQGLGLPTRPTAPLPTSDSTDRSTVAETTAEAETEADKAPTVDAPRPAEAAEATGAPAGGWTGDTGERCSIPCRLARAICDAARRICSIADYLRDQTARGKCVAAKDDCNEAREKAGTCRECR